MPLGNVRVWSEVYGQGPNMFDIGGMSAAVAGIAQGAASFAKAAADGSFAVSETGGRALLEAIREMRQWIDGQDLGSVLPGSRSRRWAPATARRP